MVTLVACSGSSSTTGSSGTNPTGGDAGSTADSAATSNPDGGTATDGGGGSCATSCGSGLACDPADQKCKPDGTTTNIGATCTRTGPDPKCGTLPTATCNDLTNDGFPGGYCSVEPCTTAELCPIGSSCGAMGGESAACFKNCKTDADCRTPDYKCQPMDQLAISGASKTVCHLAQLPCATAPDCPSSLPKCVNKVCGK